MARFSLLSLIHAVKNPIFSENHWNNHQLWYINNREKMKKTESKNSKVKKIINLTIFKPDKVKVNFKERSQSQKWTYSKRKIQRYQ